MDYNSSYHLSGKRCKEKHFILFTVCLVLVAGWHRELISYR